jgi:hypothetical protein
MNYFTWYMTFNIRFYFTVCTQPTTCTLPSSVRVLGIVSLRITYTWVETCYSCKQTQTVLPKYSCVLTDTNFVNSPQSVSNNNKADARDYYVRVTKVLNNCTVIHLGKTCNFRSDSTSVDCNITIQKKWERRFVWLSVWTLITYQLQKCMLNLLRR